MKAFKDWQETDQTKSLAPDVEDLIREALKVKLDEKQMQLWKEEYTRQHQMTPKKTKEVRLARVKQEVVEQIEI